MNRSRRSTPSRARLCSVMSVPSQSASVSTSVIVTHDIDEAVLMADRALIMAGSPGKIYDELDIDLPDPRERQDPAVRRCARV